MYPEASGRVVVVYIKSDAPSLMKNTTNTSKALAIFRNTCMRFLASFHAVFISRSLSFHMYTEKVHTINVFSSPKFDYYLVKKRFFILLAIPVCISESPRRDEFFFSLNFVQFFNFISCMLSRRRKNIYISQTTKYTFCVHFDTRFLAYKQESKKNLAIVSKLIKICIFLDLEVHSVTLLGRLYYITM